MSLAHCPGINCPLKTNCLRYRARVLRLHYDFLEITPYNFKKTKCEFYKPIKDEQRTSGSDRIDKEVDGRDRSDKDLQVR